MNNNKNNKAEAGESSAVILGVPFFTGSLDDVVRLSLSGGLVVAPSGPGLAVDFVASEVYRKALTTADLVITDSAWMVLLWKLCMKRTIPRHSGLQLMRLLLEQPEFQMREATFWIMPSQEEDIRNRAWLNRNGFKVTADDVYLAPYYSAVGEIGDKELVRRITARRPRFVIICIGGGVQERLGLMLRQELGSDCPSLICLGAAIAFITGGQAPIPPWADRYYMGWLLRILHSPRRFWRRYWHALRLAPLIFRYRSELPPLREDQRVTSFPFPVDDKTSLPPPSAL